MANRKNPPPDLGTPPDKYDPTFMLTMIRKLEAFASDLKTPGEAVEGSLALINVPSNAGGLRPGDTWRDSNGFLKVVGADELFAVSFPITPKVGRAVAA